MMAAVIGLSGCGKSYWYSTTKDATAFQQDRFQCEAEAATYSTNMGQAGKKSMVEKRMADCMKLRGYGQADESDVPKGAAKFE
jgi:ABC-type dipeptide/oligopeptide/nickel transport system ATPase component